MDKKFKNKVEMDMAVGFYDSGIAHADRGEWVQAIADFTKVIQLNPTVAEAYFNRAVSHTKLGNLAQALVDLTEVIKLTPNDPIALHNRAVIYLHLKDFKCSREDFVKVKRLGGKVNPEFEKMLNGAIK